MRKLTDADVCERVLDHLLHAVHRVVDKVEERSEQVCASQPSWIRTKCRQRASTALQHVRLLRRRLVDVRSTNSGQPTGQCAFVQGKTGKKLGASGAHSPCASSIASRRERPKASRCARAGVWVAHATNNAWVGPVARHEPEAACAPARVPPLRRRIAPTRASRSARLGLFSLRRSTPQHRSDHRHPPRPAPRAPCGPRG